MAIHFAKEKRKNQIGVLFNIYTNLKHHHPITIDCSNISIGYKISTDNVFIEQSMSHRRAINIITSYNNTNKIDQAINHDYW